MASNKNKTKSKKISVTEENLYAGVQIITTHPLFGDLYGKIYYCSKNELGKDTPAIVRSDASILLNKDLYLSPKQWAYAIAHCMLHLAFGHFDAEKMPGYETIQSNGISTRKPTFNKFLWNKACDIYIHKFLTDVKFGEPLFTNAIPQISGNCSDELSIYEYLVNNGAEATENLYGTAASNKLDMYGLDTPIFYDKNSCNHYARQFAYALANSVSKAVSISGGHAECTTANTPAGKAAKWFTDHYPLLGALASSFKIIEDYRYFQQHEIHVAAIDVTLGEIYINPSCNYSVEEWKFILAHEYLHAGLCHHERCKGRDHYLWNVACDFVINSWLKEMHIGMMPADGLLYDESLRGFSAETIYDMILKDMRKYAKLDTFRGYGKGDIMSGAGSVPGFKDKNPTTLDDFCRSALQQGLEFHQSQNRGFLPAGLIEEIRALSMPPIPWDVELAYWFDVHFAPLEKYRTYARPSRRQSSTPDMPRPRYAPLDIPEHSRTFGVVVDTSGSMSTKQIGMALGSIASYSAAKDIPYARVVFCDADAYDAGYLSPEDIAGRVAVQGRGGTVLQPAVDLLEKARDFPKDGPILVITDGMIESDLKITHEHAFLLPKGNRLPFRSKGEVFYFEG